MNSCGTLSPSMMPRTVRPNSKLGMSRVTSVPGAELPIRPQVPP